MCLDIQKHFIQHQMPTVDGGLMALCPDAGAQHQHHKHLQHASFIDGCAKIVDALRGLGQLARQIFQQHKNFNIRTHGNLAKRHHLKGSRQVGLLVRKLMQKCSGQLHTQPFQRTVYAGEHQCPRLPGFENDHRFRIHRPALPTAAKDRRPPQENIQVIVGA